MASRRADLRGLPGDDAADDFLAARPPDTLSHPRRLVQIERFGDMHGLPGHLDDRQHEGPVAGEVGVIAIQTQGFVRYGVEEPLPERAEMLPHIASATLARPLEADRVVGRLVDAQHRTDGHVGRLIADAEGQSLGLTAERELRPAEGLAVTLSANLEKFAGGEARIPFGKVELNEGEWSRRFGVSVEYALDDRTTLGLDSRLFLPGDGEAAVRAGLRFERSF